MSPKAKELSVKNQEQERGFRGRRFATIKQTVFSHYASRQHLDVIVPSPLPVELILCVFGNILRSNP